MADREPKSDWMPKLEQLVGQPITKKPLVFAVSSPAGLPISSEDADKLKEEWLLAFNGKPPAPLVILPAGCNLEGVG